LVCESLVNTVIAEPNAPRAKTKKAPRERIPGRPQPLQI